MLFNSLAFLFFFVVVFFLYWRLQSRLRLQNILLLVASYFFYGYWDPRFLLLLAFSTFLDYYTGLRIYNANTKRDKKKWIIISLTINLGFLFVFKYYNFFIGSFAALLSSFGLEPHLPILHVILPIGISFYTFHGISYIMDIYYGRVTPTKNIVDYSVFVGFFPLLVAGPIERANHLLPQVQKPRTFDYDNAAEGLRQVLWGLFKKIVVADVCGMFADIVFDKYETASGSTLAMAAVFFAIQIYGDFSGYSDIALGISRLMGFQLIRNFAYPYFSRDIAEFWRRWHISLSSWFRDYVYIPLGGSRGGTWMSIRNVFIIFLLSGFWHGANWTFIVWGGLNAAFFLPSLLMGSNRNHLDIVAHGRLLPSIREVVNMGVTFALVTFAWIFFRSANMGMAIDVVRKIFSPSLMTMPSIFPKLPFLLIGFLLIVEWFGREHHSPLSILKNWPLSIRWSFYLGLVMVIFMLHRQAETFIYFQF